MGISFTAHLCIIAGFLPYVYGAEFSAYWNVFMSNCTNCTAEVLDQYGILHNTDDTYIGDRIALFYESRFGRYPYYKDYNLSLPINSGSPQNLTTEDLNTHVNISLYNITTYIKRINSSGLGVVDFEEWRPLYDINSVKKVVYKIAAIKLTKKNHPNMSDDQVNKTAVTEYDEAAKEFLLITLRNATNERNKTLWGMYGFPYCNYDAGDLKNRTQPEFKDYRCTDKYQNFNDRMQYIYNASQALYPSIYLNNKTDYQRNFRYVQAIMAETLRVAQNYTPPLPIYVYSKFEYDPVKELCSFYTKEDLCTTIVLPYMMGANGTIFWSSSNNITRRCDIVRDFVDTTLGPLVQNVTELSRTNFTLPVYDINNTTLNFNATCDEYLSKIEEFTHTRCPNQTSAATPTLVQPAAAAP